MSFVSVKSLLIEKLTEMESMLWFDSRTMELNEPLDTESKLKKMTMVFIAPHKKAKDIEHIVSLLLEIVSFAEPVYLSHPCVSGEYLNWGYANFFEMLYPGDVVENNANVRSVHFGAPVGHTLIVIMSSDREIAKRAADTGVNSYSVHLSKIPYFRASPRSIPLRC